MNNNKQQRLDKLTSEYNDLSGKISRLDNFINRLDFETTVPDSEEQMLMQHQLNAMGSYRTNLKRRILLLQAQIKQDLNKPGRQVCGDGIATQQHHCGQDECNRSGLMTLKEVVNDYVERCDENGRLKIDLHHCSQDAVNEEQLTDGMAERLTNGYKNYCRAALEAYLERKITWWQLKEKMLMPDLVEWVKACGQDATCPVGGGNAAVITGDSLKDLLGMEVISVGDMPCDACNPDNYAGRPCVKVELVGGTYLCLAPQPNSIITE